MITVNLHSSEGIAVSFDGNKTFFVNREELEKVSKTNQENQRLKAENEYFRKQMETPLFTIDSELATKLKSLIPDNEMTGGKIVWVPDNQWRPIETAPKDGTLVLLYGRGIATVGYQKAEGYIVIGYWDLSRRRWFTELEHWGIDTAIYWMPLPEKPKV